MIQIMLIECCVCEATFGTENKTGEHRCPECNAKNERYLFDKNITEEEVDLVGKVFKDIKDVFNTYGFEDVSNIKIIDLILGK